MSDLREKLAEREHARWARWQAWCHKILRDNCPSPELEKVLERWDRQIATPYNKLSKSEKDSDRKEVEEIIQLITKAGYIPFKPYSKIPADQKPPEWWSKTPTIMPAEEWYARFVTELRKQPETGGYSPQYDTPHVLEAARKAAGIADEV